MKFRKKLKWKIFFAIAPFILIFILWSASILYVANLYFVITGEIQEREEQEELGEATYSFRDGLQISLDRSTVEPEGFAAIEIAENLDIPLYVVLGTHFMETNLSSEGDELSPTGALGPMQFQPSTWNTNSDYWTKYTGEAAVQMRKSKGLSGFSGYRFEWVEPQNYEKFVDATGGAEAFGYQKVPQGSGFDYDRDGRADPKDMGDALLSTAVYLRNYKKQIDEDYDVSEEASWFLASVAYISGGGGLSQNADELIKIIENVEYREGDLFYLSNTNIKSSPRSVYQTKFYDKYVDESKFSEAFRYSKVPRYAFGVLNAGHYLASNFTDFYGGALPDIDTGNVNSRYFTPPFRDKAYIITSEFGQRIPPKPGASSNHTGVDLSTKARGETQRIYAAAPGIVYSKGFDKGAGYYVNVFHPEVMAQTRYFHLAKSASVEDGQYVTRNTVLGWEGTTGTSTGNHLHFEILIHPNFNLGNTAFKDVRTFNGYEVNPLTYSPSTRSAAAGNVAKNGPYASQPN